MSRPVSRRKGRRLAVQAVYSWDVGGTDVVELQKFGWANISEGVDLSFPRILVAGVLAEIEAIDDHINRQLSHWTIDRVARVDLAILRVSVYGLCFQRDVPADVTIDEAVELAKELSTDDSYRFINGVLDGVCRRLADGAS